MNRSIRKHPGLPPLSAWLIAPLVALALACSAAAEEPEQVVERLHGSLLEVMRQADEMGYEGRYRHLEPVVGEVFDLPAIARVVLGRHWRELDAEQQARFLAVFEDLTIATYASRFNGYDKEEFRPAGSRELDRGHRLVRTELVEPGGERTQLDYVLRPVEDRWAIINVLANGVSDLSLKRAEYTAVIADRGFDGLLSSLDEQIRAYARP